MSESSNDKLNLNNYCFEVIHFYKVETLNYTDFPIVQEYQDVLQKTLPKLFPRRKIEYEIEIISTMPKLIPLYKLSPLKNKTLKKYFSEALEKI